MSESQPTEPLTEAIELRHVGIPVPNEWQLQQVQTPDGVMLVKLIVLSPTGIHASFWEPDDVLELARVMRNAGRNAKAGVWQHGRPSGSQGAGSGATAPDVSSPSTADSRRV